MKQALLDCDEGRFEKVRRVVIDKIQVLNVEWTRAEVTKNEKMTLDEFARLVTRLRRITDRTAIEHDNGFVLEHSAQT